VPGSLVGERTVALIGGALVDDVSGYAQVLLFVSLAGLVAVGANRISERVRVPAPALFLVAAAVAAHVVPQLAKIDVLTVQRVVTIMLVVLLFDGGMHIGWRRFRESSGAIIWLGVMGTLATTAGVGVLLHYAFGFEWLPALLLGVALSPTDPAVVFSVLGRREIGGRSGTILEGESGANDPVGIAAMSVLLGAGTATGGWTVVGHGALDFTLQMLIGGAVGLVGGRVLSFTMTRMPLPSGALYPLRTLLSAGAIYGLGTWAHGSGFLAVFVAGIVVGDIRAPYKAEIERFHSSMASLAEIVAFGLLGLTVSFEHVVSGGYWLIGLAVGVLLAVVVRPLLVGLLLQAVALTRGERLFVMWAGLKGAVPVLLGTYLLSADVPDAERLYEVVVAVVIFSVVVQGGSVPWAARRLGVPMYVAEPEPWSLGVRLRSEPSSVARYVVRRRSPADGTSLVELPLGEDAWVSLVIRDGAVLGAWGDTVLKAGDEVLLIVDEDANVDLSHLFAVPPRGKSRAQR
jgi:cell volume regulation protein A